MFLPMFEKWASLTLFFVNLAPIVVYRRIAAQTWPRKVCIVVPNQVANLIGDNHANPREQGLLWIV